MARSTVAYDSSSSFISITVFIILSARSGVTPALSSEISVFVTSRLSAAAFLPFPMPSLTTMTVRPSPMSCQPQQSPFIVPEAAYCDAEMSTASFSRLDFARLPMLLWLLRAAPGRRLILYLTSSIICFVMWNWLASAERLST